MVSGKEKDERRGLANAGLAWAVADRIDAFWRAHPEEGMNSRNDFTNRACLELLERLETRVLRRVLLAEMEQGRSTPVKALKKLGIKLDDTE